MDTHVVHLVIVDRSLNSVLVRHVSAGWLLPYLSGHPRERTATRQERLLASLGQTGTLIHEARLSDRGDDGRSHSYSALVCGAAAAGPGDLVWTARSTLRATNALLPLQFRALELCAARLAAPSAPFDAPDSAVQVASWVSSCVAEAGHEITGPADRYRYSRVDAVLAFPTTGGCVYFKGGPSRFRTEGLTTVALLRLVPDAFPRMVCIDHDRAWWLAWEQPGRSLWNMTPTASTLERVAERMAQIQKAVLHGADDLTALLPTVGVDRLRATACHAMRVLGEQETTRLDGLASQIAAALDWYERNALPTTWIHTDLMPPNILVNDDQVSFLDLEDGVMAQAPLVLWRLVDHLQRTAEHAAALIAALYAAYAREWRDLIPEEHMREALARLEIVGRLLDLEVSLRRLGRRASDDGIALERAREAQLVRLTFEGLLTPRVAV